MQNSELYRRSVVLPLDAHAEESLRVNDVDHSTHVQVLDVPDDVLSDMFEMGLFEAINANCETFIDEYEDEWLDAAAMGGVLHAIDSVAGLARRPSTKTFLANLRTLVVEASEQSRPLLFVL
ncbi:MAG: hypothetical protein KDA20_10690 [Phycisphaerales bacterium]|nr:hypothetical protein [Phycisphaerales bacterium]